MDSNPFIRKDVIKTSLNTQATPKPRHQPMKSDNFKATLEYKISFSNNNFKNIAITFREQKIFRLAHKRGLKAIVSN